MADSDNGNRAPGSGREGGPLGGLKDAAGGLLGAFADRALSSVRGRLQETVGGLTDIAEGKGGPGLVAAITGAKAMAQGKSPGRALLSAGWAGAKNKVAGIFGRGKGKSGGKQKLKLTNIVETIDVGVPLRLAYNQWTTYQDFPTFTKKVENAEPGDENKTVKWKAQIFWSHREWEATILDQRPDERIVWRSKGQKGHVDGVVTFHELGPRLTRIIVVLEYHPQGMFERTGNLWRAQGRRTRLELKHFKRHVMAHALLKPDEIEGWRGTIEDGEVVKDHETALQEESRERGQEPEAAENGQGDVSDEAEAGEVGDEAGDTEEAGDEEAGAEREPAGREAEADGDQETTRRRPRGGPSATRRRASARAR